MDTIEIRNSVNGHIYQKSERLKHFVLITCGVFFQKTSSKDLENKPRFL